MSVRRIPFAMASACPDDDAFAMAHHYLQRAFNTG